MSARPDCTPQPAPPQPTGAVSFVFLDVENSIARWEQHREAMGDALHRYDAIVRDAVAAHAGFVFKAVGDFFCCAYERPDDAIATVAHAQRALAAADFSAVGGLPMRAAVHTGVTDERDGDYFGTPVNRVARLLAIAHGGQVLVSGVTCELVRGTLPPELTLVDLGDHRLRDLAQPERVFQLVAPGLAHHFPPLRSLGSRPNNLPQALTTFVGREAEIAEIRSLVQASRLVTLVGTGGVGKTRTSLQLGAELLVDHPDGVWFIELAPLLRGDFIPATIAQLFGIALATDRDAIGQLVEALRHKDALLIVDNCEHVVADAAHLIGALLRGCPKLRFLTSTRQALGLAGEAVYRVPSLPVPSEFSASCAADAGRFPAVALFVERARQADLRFALTDENAPVVADICRRLDGIALAIELAAARTKIMSPQQLRLRLDERFRVLTGGSRDVLPRQQTLRALIDWSHDLLDARERTMFARLSIFAGGFTIDGATDVGRGDDELDEFEVLDLLTSLVDKSLVHAEPDGAGDLRYRMLETTKAYAREKLDASPDGRATAARHRRFFRDAFAAAREAYNASADHRAIDALLLRELEEVRLALTTAREAGDAALGADLLWAIDSRWDCAAPFPEAIAYAQQLLGLLAPADVGRATALWLVIANAHNACGSYQRGFVAATRAVELAQGIDDPKLRAEALMLHGWTLAHRDDDHELARLTLAQAQAIAPRHDLVLRANILYGMAMATHALGDLAAAADAYREHMNVYARAGNATIAAMRAIPLADLELQRGNARAALDLLSQHLPQLQAGSDRTFAYEAMIIAAAAHADLGGIAEAHAVSRDVFAARGDDQLHERLLFTQLHGSAHIALAAGDAQRAAMLAAFIDAALAQFDDAVSDPPRVHQRARLADGLAHALAPEALAELRARGAALQFEQALELARTLHAEPEAAAIAGSG